MTSHIVVLSASFFLRSYWRIVKNKLDTTTLAALLAVLGACAGANEEDPGDAKIVQLKERLLTPTADDVMVVAHRTCWRDTSENSIDGIARCIELGVDIVEIDVRSTSDGVLVLMHDETIDRTTDGSGRINDKTYAEVQELRLLDSDGRLSKNLSNRGVPTLEEALALVKGQILVNLDIKEPVQDQALEIVRKLDIGDQTILKSFSAPDENELGQTDFYSDAHFMPIVVECPNAWGPNCASNLAEVVEEYERYNPIAIEIVNKTDEFLVEGAPSVADAGLRLWANTLGPDFAAGRSDDKSRTDPDANWGYVIEAGVNMIQTDRPEELLSYLKLRRSRGD